jgi:ubiquinone/menaquinone biosynthesis C-methylase UbiE
MRSLLHSIVAVPFVYDLVQRAAGWSKISERLALQVKDTSGQLVLDVGAGTGSGAELLPSGARYLWLDSDPQKLNGFKKKHPESLAILGDGSMICLQDKSVDVTLCLDVTHHIPDEYIASFLKEVRRVTRERLVFLDPLVWNSKVSRLLWHYDRGSFPRPFQTLYEVLQKHFEIEYLECFSVYHHYILCVGRPR